MIPLLADVIFCVLLLGAFAGTGRRILDRAGYLFASELQAFGLGLAVGTTAAMFLLFLMGFFGLLRPWPVGILLAAFLGAGWKDCAGWVRRLSEWGPVARLRGMSGFLWIVCAVTALMIAGNLIRANAPPTTDDELSYHLYVPKCYSRTGDLRPPPVDHYPNYYPQTPEMLYTAALLLRRDITPAILHFFFGLACALLVAAIARRFGGPAVPLLAFAVFYSMPRFTALAHVAYSDFILLCLTLAAFEAYLQWIESRVRRWLLLSCVLASAALASKFSALTVALALLLLYLIDLPRSKDPWPSVLKTLLFTTLCLTVFFAPWFLRNFIYKANPFYPFSAFGMRGDEIAHYLAESFKQDLPTRLRRIAELPHTLLTYDFSQGVGPLVFFWPLAVLFFRPLSEATKAILWFTAIHVLSTLWILNEIGISRYTLMSHALWAVLAAAALSALLELPRRSWRLAVQALVIVPLLVPDLAFSAAGALKRLPFTLGRLTREQYLEKFYGQEGYDTVRFVNQNLAKDARILMIYGDCARPYYYEADLVFCNSIRTLNAPDYETIRPYLVRQGVTHILFMKYFGWKKDDQGVWTLPPFHLGWLKDAEDRGALTTVFDNGKAVIYRIGS